MALRYSKWYGLILISWLSIGATQVAAAGFLHRATAANISGNSTLIDNPATNGNPNVLLEVTPNWNPGAAGGVYDKHPIGVWYANGKWAIFNQDLAAMPVGAAFNVGVQLVPTVLQHASAANITQNWTLIDNPVINGHPEYPLVVTPNWNPGGVVGAYENHAIGVWYTNGKWAIFNQDLAPMPAGAAFNVSCPSGSFIQKTNAGNVTKHWTTIDNPATNGNPNALIVVTPNWNPGGAAGGTYDNHPIGVWYTAGHWAIFNQDFAAMPVGAAFNVKVVG